MAAAFDLQAHVSDVTKCPICLEDYKDPKSLPCLHTFCLECLRSYVQDKLPGDELLCPTCRNSCHIPEGGISAFPLNFFMNDLLQAHNTAKMATQEMLPCEVCFEVCEEESVATPPATKYCIDCCQHFCEKCNRLHAKMKTGAHHVLPLGESMSTELIKSRKRYCCEHKDERVKLYCYDCKTNICSLCMALKHKQHNIAEITEAADKLGRDIDKQVNAVVDCITNIHDLEQQWDVEKQEFLTEAEKLEATVKQSGEEMKKIVDDHVDNLLQELQVKKLNFSKEVECGKEELKMTAVAMQSYINYSHTVKERGNSSDITHAADELCTRATSLLQADILSKTVESPDIVFVPPDYDKYSVGKDVNLVGRWSFGNDVLVTPSAASSSSDNDEEDTEQVPSSSAEQQVAVKVEQPVPVPVKTPPKTLKMIHSWNAIAVSSLDKELFVLQKSSPQIDVYDAVSFTSLGSIVIPRASYSRNFVDMVACSFYHCLYIADAGNPNNKCHKCVIRLEIPSKHTEWQLEDIDSVTAISVTSSHHVLVLCGGIKLFNTIGVLHKTVELPPDLVSVSCAVELTPGQYVVTHGRGSDALHRVCVVNGEGKVLRTFGGLRGSYNKLLNSPSDVAVDNDGYVYVDDEKNNRLVMLTQNLGYIHCIPGVFTGSSSGRRRRMKVDKELRRIYVVHHTIVDPWNKIHQITLSVFKI